MPIVSHTLDQQTQTDGGTYNIVRLYDQDATEYLQTFRAPAGFDVAGRVQGMYADLNEQLKAREFETIFGAD
jgi:hypothetical protein